MHVITLHDLLIETKISQIEVLKTGYACLGDKGLLAEAKRLEAIADKDLTNEALGGIDHSPECSACHTRKPAVVNVGHNCVGEFRLCRACLAKALTLLPGE